MSAEQEEVIANNVPNSGEQQHQEAEAAPAEAAPSKDTPYDEQDADEDEKEETCGFCIFMKGGGCKDAFNAWSSCVDRERDAGNDFTEECREATIRLRECMLEHRDYYAPLLEEEEAEMEAARQAAAEKAEAEATSQEPKAA